MRDRRPVDELSIDELEQVLLLRKRQARLQRFRGAKVAIPAPEAPPFAPAAPEKKATPRPSALVDYGLPPTTPPAEGEDPRFEDSPRYGPPRPTRRGMWNGLLLGVEILAMLGVLAVLVISVQAYLRLNQDLAEVDKVNATAQAVNAALAIRPTATPLITVNRVVLPGGHVWDANGQHRFNLLEVPEPYRLAFQEQLNAPRTELAAPVAGGPIRVQIPAIALDASVRAGDDWISLQAGVGHYPNSGKPGQKGNMVLTGHNDIFGEVFRRLEELNAGTEIRVQSTEGQWYTYVVREKQVVEPTEVWVLDQNLGAQVPLMTLITCHPYRVNTHRMIVFAEWVN